MVDAPDPPDWAARKELLAARVTVGLDLVGDVKSGEARILVVAPEVRLSVRAAMLMRDMIDAAIDHLTRTKL